MHRKPRTVVDAVLSFMEDPSGQSGYPTEQPMQQNMGMANEEERGFSMEDYECAREFVTAMGGLDRAREALENLSEVEDTLELEPESSCASEVDIDTIASQMPDELDDGPNIAGMATLYNPSHLGPV